MECTASQDNLYSILVVLASFWGHVRDSDLHQWPSTAAFDTWGSLDFARYPLYVEVSACIPLHKSMKLLGSAHVCCWRTSGSCGCSSAQYLTAWVFLF
ncbi:hypothetical protein SCLCIDRAFT_1213143 [Scleroderma citrinum Foug A]|uniref:Uncharacterized protein n=1 Tax=Scleroderma citrinum Foug A TaxID=1036808 RepID=A0A0C3DVP7_9AGAM|nr:hypothetical protein SCLCIDRAFT_1213143 [Scleroderma citrinum Foug A]